MKLESIRNNTKNSSSKTEEWKQGACSECIA